MGLGKATTTRWRKPRRPSKSETGVLASLPIGEGPRERLRKFKIILFAPDAPKWTNVEARKYSKKYTDIILICGRYEGIDKRVEKILKATRVSVGDFVLTGGEVPAMILIDTISRQIKGVLGDHNSLEENRTDVLGEKITKKVDEFYTRPEVLEWPKSGKVKKYKVPKVFLSGNPKLINEYRNGGLV
jgi:tRNA (guanine37-N1)-methyltransferase